MTAAASLAATRERADDETFRRCLVDALGRAPSSVTEVSRERSAYASSYDAEIVTLRLAGATDLTLFLKDFSASGFPKDDLERRRDRERGVYRDLLADASLGTASYYGSVWDDAGGRYWLLLELVRGSELRACDLEYWIMAAAWLGRLHAYFAPLTERLGACAYLQRHDAEFFGMKGERAAREVRHVSEPLGHRFDDAMSRYDRASAVMAAQPRTLVHGHFRPCNVLVSAQTDPVRICPVDWEQAAVGSGVYDLALLTDGFAPPQLDQLLIAYREEALAHGLDVPDFPQLRHAVDCFRLFIEVNLLGRARERALSDTKVSEIVRRLEQRARVLESLDATVAATAASVAELRGHPATRAWVDVGAGGKTPAGITRLQKKRKAAVYRLARAGPSGENVVAKHSSRSRISEERAIYERVLSSLSVPTVACYGCLDESQSDSAWLFLEDVGDASYSADVAEHRAIAARWLALLHTTAPAQLSSPVVAGLADRGPGYYLAQLRSARETILATLHNPALTADDVAVLRAIVRQCDIAESHWGDVEEICGQLPRTLIHGDFAPKNMRLRTGAGAPTLLPFDWGSAGWGVVAADLVQAGPDGRWNYWASPELAVYADAVREWSGGVGVRELDAVAAVGKMFRCLVCVRLSAEAFTTPWVERSARNMSIYRAEMADALCDVGWSVGEER
jgi:aminoglycoside phosphotransferase (APT) family kinase protein